MFSCICRHRSHVSNLHGSHYEVQENEQSGQELSDDNEEEDEIMNVQVDKNLALVCNPPTPCPPPLVQARPDLSTQPHHSFHYKRV